MQAGEDIAKGTKVPRSKVEMSETSQIQCPVQISLPRAHPSGSPFTPALPHGGRRGRCEAVKLLRLRLIVESGSASRDVHEAKGLLGILVGDVTKSRHPAV
eukprot:TRINITY_DN12538_c0_g4_i1.p2 TRINITY_DN12538_c0_g4~~TRINITY_DN12538_c0_g4_i1.p2  ORF type:complete len:101 (+),score=3.42 TRINITY_DN12538_c0_g4_i1:719-1021(+)